jgi:hypothetical protein
LGGGGRFREGIKRKDQMGTERIRGEGGGKEANKVLFYTTDCKSKYAAWFLDDYQLLYTGSKG